MPKSLSLLPLLALAACTTEPPGDASARIGPELAREVAGRVPGEARSCVSQRELQGNRSTDDGAAIIFEGRTRGTIWVNRPPVPCPSLRPNRALVIRTPSTSFCSGEIVDVGDLSAGINYGSCSLGDFVPYRKTN